MARVSYNPLIAKVRGVAADVNFCKGVSTPYIRARYGRKDARSPSQLVVRESLSRTTDLWRSLPTAVRMDWHRWAGGRSLTGFNLFTHYNRAAEEAHAAFTPTPLRSNPQPAASATVTPLGGGMVRIAWVLGDDPPPGFALLLSREYVGGAYETKYRVLSHNSVEAAAGTADVPWTGAPQTTFFLGFNDKVPVAVEETVDNFNDNWLDPALWASWDTGGNVNEQNQRLEVKGTPSWGVNGVSNKSAYYQQQDGSWYKCKAYASAVTTNYALYGIGKTNAALDWTTGIMLFLRNLGDVWVIKDGVQADTGFNYQAGVEYEVTFLSRGPGLIDIYMDGGLFENQLVYAASASPANLNRFEFQVYNPAMYYVDNLRRRYYTGSEGAESKYSESLILSP